MFRNWRRDGHSIRIPLAVYKHAEPIEHLAQIAALTAYLYSLKPAVTAMLVHTKRDRASS
jgi:hypothetical protein